MRKENKYPMVYHKETELYSQSQAVDILKQFVKAVKESPTEKKDKSYHLYLNENKWAIIADSVKDQFGTGEWITEIKI